MMLFCLCPPTRSNLRLKHCNAVLLKQDRYLQTKLFTALHCFSHQLFRSKFGKRCRVD